MLSRALPRTFPKIPVCPKQLKALSEGSRAATRGNLIPSVFPSLPEIRSFTNVDSIDKQTKAKTKRSVVVPADREFMGIFEHGRMLVENYGPRATKVDVSTSDDPDAKEEQMLPPGCEIEGRFEGKILFSIHTDKTIGKKKGFIAFDRYFLSNFLDVDAVKLRVDGSEVELEMCCVEIWFQIIKALLTGNLSLLKEALEQLSCPKLKGFMSKAPVPNYWFNPVDGKNAWSVDVMAYLQAWCVTCPKRFEMLCTLMNIMIERGVDPADVEIFEYSGDSKYGVGATEGDFAPLLEEDYKPKGENILGPIISDIARQAIKGSHADYVKWFQDTHPNLFELVTPAPSAEAVQEQVEEVSVLGARLASVAELPAPSGRTGSRQ